MTYTPPVRYTAEEIEEAVSTDPEHTCGEPEYNREEAECVGCDYEDNYGENGWYEFGHKDPGDTHGLVLKGETVSAVYMDGESGGEGSGESVWLVFKVGVQYFKKTGYYASYDGTSWDGDVTEVRRRQVTVSMWEEI